MRILLSNDDGITSPFLRATAQALSNFGEVKIVVPSKEQSWIGRAFSRHTLLSEEKVDYFGFDCHTVSGTPSDCVNIALAHLYKEDAMPDLVFSGINIGHNIAFPLLLSSGTFAAAVEGAGHSIASFSVSLQLKHEFYELCRINHKTSPELEAEIQTVSRHCADFVNSIICKGNIKEGSVYNINYPAGFTGGDINFCKVAKIKLESFYEKNADGKYEFKYKLGKHEKSEEPSDADLLKDSKACCSIINIYNI